MNDALIVNQNAIEIVYRLPTDSERVCFRQIPVANSIAFGCIKTDRKKVLQGSNNARHPKGGFSCSERCHSGN